LKPDHRYQAPDQSFFDCEAWTIDSEKITIQLRRKYAPNFKK